MNFEQSTQARYWMYDATSLVECRQEACKATLVDLDPNNHHQQQKKKPSTKLPSPRRFASGYMMMKQNQQADMSTTEREASKSTSNMSHYLDLPNDVQETLVHFHAHQIQRLIGPKAILPELRRKNSSLSTAIMLFKRFYLSNSVIDFHPRIIAAASALLAVKVDCENDLNIHLLSHATYLVQCKVGVAELRTVSVNEIEEAEMCLLKGLDFRLRCHHPYGAINALTSDIIYNLAKEGEPVSYGRWYEEHYCNHHCIDHSYNQHHGVGEIQSPRSIIYQYGGHNGSTRVSTKADICNRAVAVAQAALVYTDVNFLFPPGQIAFAAVAIALEGRVGRTMHEYLRQRFPLKTTEEREDFVHDVARIVAMIANCPSIDMNKFTSPGLRKCKRTIENQAVKIRQAIASAVKIRRSVIQTGVNWNDRNFIVNDNGNRKRKDRHHFSYGNTDSERPFKAVRVTPNPNLTPFYN